MIDEPTTISVPGIAGIAPEAPKAQRPLAVMASAVEVRDWADVALGPRGGAALEADLADMDFPSDLVASGLCSPEARSRPIVAEAIALSLENPRQ